MNNGFGKIDIDTLNAAKRGDKKALLSKLNESEIKTLQETLKDKDKLIKILSSESAQQLMKILGGKKNG